MTWAEEEFRGIDLGDKRRDRRAVRLLERLAERPTASIPGACKGWAETQAAYRFLANEVSSHALEGSSVASPMGSLG